MSDAPMYSESENRRLEEVENQNIGKKSRANYIGSQTRFVVWMKGKFGNNEALFNKKFFEGAEGNLTNKYVKSKLKELNRSCPPLHFENLTAKMFASFLLSLKKKNGERPGIDALKGHRAALFNLMRDYGSEFSPQQVGLLRKYMKGFRRDLTNAAKQGKASLKV